MSDEHAAELLRTVRRRSGLTQAELARRAGMPRSVLNAYEHSRRQPSAEALARLTRAAGYGLAVVPTPPVDEARAARLLGQVLDLAEALPTRTRGALRYPPFRSRVRAR